MGGEKERKQYHLFREDLGMVVIKEKKSSFDV